MVSPRSERRSSDGVIEITQCPEDNTYCCGKGNQSCCGTDNAYELRKDPTVIDDDLVEYWDRPADEASVTALRTDCQFVLLKLDAQGAALGSNTKKKAVKTYSDFVREFPGRTAASYCV